MKKKNNAILEQTRPSVITAAFAHCHQWTLVLSHGPSYVVFYLDITSHKDAFIWYSSFRMIVMLEYVGVSENDKN